MHLKITVVTPSFNQAQFLEDTMESIHGQGYPNLEHIVIDGGSTDGSVEIIRRYEDRLAYWVSEPDAGQTDALIKGFSRSTGDIQCWLNSDDLFEPWTLKEVGEFFRQNVDAQFVYGDSAWIDAEGRLIKLKREHGFNRFVWLNDHNYLPQPSTFWRRSLYERAGGLDQRFDMAMDADLWIRFADLCEPRHIKRPWSRARFYADQKNTSMRSRTIAEVETIRARYTEEESSTVRVVKTNAARAMHVGLKLVSGAYSLSELGLHVRGFRRGGWERRHLDRVSDQRRADS